MFCDPKLTAEERFLVSLTQVLVGKTILNQCQQEALQGLVLATYALYLKNGGQGLLPSLGFKCPQPSFSQVCPQQPSSCDNNNNNSSSSSSSKHHSKSNKHHRGKRTVTASGNSSAVASGSATGTHAFTGSHNISKNYGVTGMASKNSGGEYDNTNEFKMHRGYTFAYDVDFQRDANGSNLSNILASWWNTFDFTNMCDIWGNNSQETAANQAKGSNFAKTYTHNLTGILNE